MYLKTSNITIISNDLISIKNEIPKGTNTYQMDGMRDHGLDQSGQHNAATVFLYGCHKSVQKNKLCITDPLLFLFLLNLKSLESHQSTIKKWQTEKEGREKKWKTRKKWTYEKSCKLTLTELSEPAVAMQVPEGWKATRVVEPLSSGKVWSVLADWTSWSLTVLSSAQDTSIRPSGENRTQRTWMERVGYQLLMVRMKTKINSGVRTWLIVN